MSPWTLSTITATTLLLLTQCLIGVITSFLASAKLLNSATTLIWPTPSMELRQAPLTKLKFWASLSMTTLGSVWTTPIMERCLLKSPLLKTFSSGLAIKLNSSLVWRYSMVWTRPRCSRSTTLSLRWLSTWMEEIKLRLRTLTSFSDGTPPWPRESVTLKQRASREVTLSSTAPSWLHLSLNSWALSATLS